MKIVKSLLNCYIAILLFLFPVVGLAQEGESQAVSATGSVGLDTEEASELADKLVINFFYGRKCAYCAVEQKFLDELEKKYPQVVINRYPVDEPEYYDLLEDLARGCEAERYLGLVPLTFVGDEFFLGFDEPEGIGAEIETAVERGLENVGESAGACKAQKVRLPIIGEVDIGKYSLPVLAVILGTLDGFNVCSLGALVLILGLVLALRSREKILFYGGIFVITTAIVYGLLIVLWYQLFAFLSPYLKIMELLIGVLGIGGGIYFLRQFIKFRKQGPACELNAGQQVMSKFSLRLRESFRRPGNILAIIGSVLIFAVVVTIVEFPCSAAVPVVYAGVLAQSGLSSWGYLFYIALFILFYMLDEIIVFLVAFFKMSIWLSSSKFVTWMALVGSIVLFLLGFYYLLGF